MQKIEKDIDEIKIELEEACKRVAMHEIEDEQQEDRFLNLLELAPDSILIVDQSGIIVLVNTQTEKLFGYTRNELLGMELEVLVPDRFRNLHRTHRHNYNANPHTRPMGSNLDLYAKRKDGTEFPVEISLSPFKSSKGMLVTSIIRDVTERKHAEEALQKAYSRLQTINDELEKRVAERTKELSEANRVLKEEMEERRRASEQVKKQAELLDKTQDAIFVQDLSGQIVFWNKGAEKIYGWKKEEAIGRNVADLIFKDNTYLQFNLTDGDQIKTEGVSEVRQVTRDGRAIVVESRWNYLKIDGDAESESSKIGKVEGIIVVNTDITEKKKLSEQFLRAQRMESIGTLASGIAHDLNNSLTPVLVASKLLADSELDEDKKLLVNMISSGADRSADMVRQVLSFARGVDGERVLIQLKHIIQEIKKIVQQTFPKSIFIDTKISKDLWPVLGDATQLYQVMMNLCVNARDAMPEGGRLLLEVENVCLDENYARMHIEAKPGNFIYLSVTDTGTGISSEVMQRIFEPFFTTKDVGKGTGLGLSTVLTIVRSHGGFVDVYSELTKGTTFKIYLPAAIESANDRTVFSSHQMPCGNGELILVVDDELAIRDITKVTLENYGYKVVTASDGTEAVAVFAKRQEEVKAVIIDMMMPNLDGQATIKILQKLDPKVKIISTSGLTSNERILEVTNVQAFLLKPYTAEKLLDKLAEVLKEAG
ncbi:MAG: PAS domain S-box protein [Blastocatellia bacterium]|nr:PAS domain S-box protein [Blastocatellia bacterium]